MICEIYLRYKYSDISRIIAILEPERRKETALPERAQRSWNSNLLKVKTERRMKIRLLKIFAAVAVLLSFGSCSLLKVSVDTGNPPLPASRPIPG